MGSLINFQLWFLRYALLTYPLHCPPLRNSDYVHCLPFSCSYWWDTNESGSFLKQEVVDGMEKMSVSEREALSAIRFIKRLEPNSRVKYNSHVGHNWIAFGADNKARWTKVRGCPNAVGPNEYDFAQEEAYNWKEDQEVLDFLDHDDDNDDDDEDDGDGATEGKQRYSRQMNTEMGKDAAIKRILDNARLQTSQPNSDIVVKVFFRNKYSEILVIYWVRPTGEEVEMAKVAGKGNGWKVSTFHGHVWIIRREDGKRMEQACVFLFMYIFIFPLLPHHPTHTLTLTVNFQHQHRPCVLQAPKWRRIM